MYKLFQNPKTKEVTCVQRLSDNAFIPFSEDNADYQAYLKFLEEGNVPEPAEVTE